MKLLKPFKIKKGYSDNNFAYQDKIEPDILETKKKNTQKIKRDYHTLTTRIKRRLFQKILRKSPRQESFSSTRYILEV
ncbi:MAG: IS1 family transposase [Ruminococcus sp.]|nr:IS1 family transposase [Ruminococcus sp.]